MGYENAPPNLLKLGALLGLSSKFVTIKKHFVSRWDKCVGFIPEESSQPAAVERKRGGTRVRGLSGAPGGGR